ncbi:MAG TPA: bifunctional diaminohydroxyphosphoribosylaminopyrimidine deaminase/5-amino-6-(5-phosphoribosylamino)uracil reductase RibD [Rhodoferax sp.]
MGPTESASVWLKHAMILARQAIYLTNPNPRVGCVITTADGKLLGQGHTQRAGGPHAEIMALRDAASQGHSVQGATAYVTLEPCAHHGRTGPCCDALIAAGIKKVVATNTDPNPLVAGQGFARMRAADIEVQVLPPDDPLAIESRELNIGFFSRMIRQTPWVRMKIAASLDGKTALPNGVSQWITSPEARADGHAWRARACTVLTGMGTVLADNPRLDVRLVDTPRQPSVALVDSRLELPLDASLFVACRPLYIWATGQNEQKQSTLEAHGAKVFYRPDGNGKVDLAAMLQDMARLEINELHVEAGPTLNGALIRAGLVDEFLIYLAPKLQGQGRDMASFGPLTELSQAVPLVFQSTQMIGPDLRVLARVQGHNQVAWNDWR